MRLSLRFLIPLLLALGVFAWAAVPLVDALMLRWFVRDLDIRPPWVGIKEMEVSYRINEEGRGSKEVGGKG